MKSILAIMLMFGSINVFAHTSEINCSVGASVVAVDRARVYDQVYIRTPEGVILEGHHTGYELTVGRQNEGTIAKFFTTDIYEYRGVTLLKKNAKMAVMIHVDGNAYSISEQDLVCL